MALAPLSLGKVPVHPSCKPLQCLHPSQQYRQDLQAHCRQNSPPAPAQSSHSQGSENSAMPVRRGRRKREPFQEKGGQLAQPSAIEDRRAEGALQGEGGSARWHLQALAIALSPPQAPCRALGQQLHLLLTVKYTQMQPWARGHSHTLQSQSTSRARRAGMPPAPHQQQCTQDPSFQV